jgi:HEAT repeat protein
LINAQKDENSFVRSSIARALGKLGWTPKDDRQRAIYLIDKGFWDDCIKIGEPAVEPLIAALKDKSDYIRENAANALGKIKDNRAVEPLIAVLNDRKGIETVQFEVVKALGAIGDSRAVKPLIAALRDPSYNLPLYAAEALGEIKDIRAVEPLIVALKHERDMVRSYAAEALGKIKDIRAIEPLIALLEDKFDMVQSYTARALRNITGEGFGISRSEWKEWWKENKHKFIK